MICELLNLTNLHEQHLVPEPSSFLMKAWSLVLVLVLLGCQTRNLDEEKRAVAIEHIKAYANQLPRPRRRAKRPFQPQLIRITPSEQGLSGSRFDVNSPTAKYLTFFHPLEAEAALIRIRLPNRDHNLANVLGEYPSGDLVEFNEHGNLSEQARIQKEYLRLQNQTERTEVLLNGKKTWMDTPKRPKIPSDQEIDISVPWGYSPKLKKGNLVLIADNEQVEFPLTGLPSPSTTNVETLPAATHIGPKGRGIEVVLRRGMAGTGLAPDPADDPKAYKEVHESMQYTGAFFTTVIDPAMSPGRTLDLVMRFRRSRWTNQPGKWFVVRARDVLNPKFEPVDEYSLSLDPASKMAEFECVLVETKAWTEKVVIPSVGTLVERSGLPIEMKLSSPQWTSTPTGWRVALNKPSDVELDDSRFGRVMWPSSLISPTGRKISELEDDTVDPLFDAHYVSDIQLSGQSTRASQYPGQPCLGPEGYWKAGPLGDAVITVCHLERIVHPAYTLRLPLLKGGKSRGQEMYINSVNVGGEKR